MLRQLPAVENSELMLTKPSPTEVKKLRALLVEDINIIQMIIRKQLEKCGVEVDVVDDGLPALALLEKQHYDFVLMDIQLLSMDGITATKILRSHANWHQPYVAALTASDEVEVDEACLLAGADTVLRKPFSKEALTEILNAI